MEKRRIAVIEDEATIAASVAARLRAEGFDVEVAEDGFSGVDLCRGFRPDLVVLDLILPGLDGLEVCRRIQRASAMQGSRRRCPRQESNLRTRFRKPLLFPLSYGGGTRPG